LLWELIRILLSIYQILNAFFHLNSRNTNHLCIRPFSDSFLQQRISGAARGNAEMT
jgi:hypothetical protein